MVEDNKNKGMRKGLTSYGDADFSLFLRKAFIKAMGYSDDALNRPIIGVANTFSGYNACHRNAPELVEAINVQSFADHVESVGKERVEWTNATAGNATGIVVRVRGDQATVLSFHSEHTQFDVKLSDVRGKEHTVDAGGVDRFVKIGPAPRTDGRRQFDASWIDTTSLPGVVPYWLRVTQVDQAMAWSSPVYVSHAGQM